MFLPHKKLSFNIITFKNSVYVNVICVPFILQQTFLAALSEMNNQAMIPHIFQFSVSSGSLTLKKPNVFTLSSARAIH